MTVQRFDKIEIKAIKTIEGYVEDSPIIGRTGLLKYMQADGSTRYEYRPDSEAFSIESLASIRGKPVTIGHPGLVRADNISAVKPIGTVLSEGKQDGNNIRADIVIYNLDTKDRELSCGYTVDLDETPGVFDGIAYSAIQRNVKYNHLAIVKKGRAGEEARLNMDSMDQIYEEEKEPEQMEKLKLDNGIAYDASPEVIVAYNQLKVDNADLTKKVTETKTAAEIAAKKAQAEMDAKDAKCDTLKAQVDKNAGDLEKVKKDAADSIQAAVTARIEMLKVADKFKLDKADELSDKDIKLAVIKTVRGDGMDLTGKSDDYIQASFDMCKEDSVTRADAMAEQRKKANDKLKQDKGEAQTSDEARQKMIDQTKNAYLGGKK